MADKHTFRIPLTREQLETARARVAHEGLVLKGDSGEAESDGVRIAFSYDGAQLVCTVVKKPFKYKFVPGIDGRIENEVREWFKEQA